MKRIIILLALFLTACQSTDAIKQKTVAPRPERNMQMANVVIWWAHGNEPFWRFTADADKLRFENLGEDAEYFAYRMFDNDGTTRTFSAKNAKTSIQIRMMQKTCFNDMSGAEYPWTAEVTIGGRKLQGCGERGRLPE